MAIFPDLRDVESLPTPCLWVDRARVVRNLERMLEQVGGRARSERLRPHVKTHKMTAVMRLMGEAGMDRCKTATLAEARLAAEAGFADVLLAHQPAGAKLRFFAELCRSWPGTRFSTVVDHEAILPELAERLGDAGNPFPVWIDVDCGMGRTGLALGPRLDRLAERILATAGLRLAGLHVYDGHLHAPDCGERRSAARRVIASVRAWLGPRSDLSVVGGGSPTFATWAEETDWECSPGTTVFWDVGYGSSFPEMPYEIAAGVLARVISRPGDNRICLDLGHKAVAAEMALERRVVFPDITDGRAVAQSEEHLVWEVSDPDSFPEGRVLAGYPRHICPTVALHQRAFVICEGRPTGETWEVTARDR